MLQIGDMFNFEILIFLLIGLGFYLSKTGLITPEFRGKLTDLLLLVILPFNILKSFLIEVNADILKACAAILIISTAIQIGSILLGPILYRKANPDQQVVLKYATMIANSSLLGMPLIQGLYGTGAGLYAAFYLIPLRISMWSAGLACFTPVKGKDVVKRILTHPCVIATGIGLVIMILQIPLPAALVQTITSVSNCTTAITMLLVGSILAGIDFRTVITKLSVYFCFIRLIGIPALVLAGCMLVGFDPLVTAVAVALSGMPAGSTTALMAEKYGGDAELGAKLTFLSTVLSLITIPAICMFMETVLL